MIKFMGPLLVVEDLQRSRRFYEGLLGMKVQNDFGVNVSFEGNLAIHLKEHFQGLLGGPERCPVVFGAHYGEMYFESDEMEAVLLRLKQAGVEFIHELVEQPWGQRVMRFYDPDGHMVEVGEPMDVTVRRLHQGGMTVEEIVGKSGLPQEYILNALGA